MTKYRLERRMRSENLVLSHPQQQIEAHKDGVLLVLGGPRTGKTTALVAAAVSRLRQGTPAVIFFTRSRPARLDLRSQIGSLYPELAQKISVTTFYSFCQSVVKDYGETGPTSLLSAGRQDGYISQILAGQPENAWPSRFHLARATRELANAIREAVAACQRCGLSSEDVIAQGVATGRDDWVSLGWFYREYLDVLGLASVMDYPELLITAQGLLQDEVIRNQVRPPGTLIVIDSMEDMDLVQAGIISALVDPVTPTILATDPDSHVFGFRGARTRSVTDMVQQWSAGGVSTRIVCLQQGYGVAQAIENACGKLRQLIPLPASIPTDQLSAYRSIKPDCDGEVVKVLFSDLVTEAEQVARILKKAHLQDHVAYQDMAILVRKKDDFPRYVMACRQAGVPVAISGDELQLNREPIVSRVLTILAAVTDTSSDLEELALDVGLDPTIARKAVEAGRAKLTESVADVLWALWNSTPFQDQLLAQIDSPLGDAVSAHRGLDSIIALFDLAEQFIDIDAPAGIVGVSQAIQNQEIPEDLPASSSWTASAVRLTTAHRAKSRSWTLVVVADVNEGTWPLRLQHSQLLSVEGLWDGIEAVDEIAHKANERKLLYAACSSSRQRLIITAVSGDERQPSKLFTQIDSLETTTADNAVLSGVSLVGRLRTVVADEDSDPRLRQAACDRLAKLRGNPIFPGADPSRWWLVGHNHVVVDRPTSAPVVLSASWMEAMFSCPRQWFLASRAQGDPPNQASADIGSIIHEVIKDPNSPMEEMMALLQSRWQDLDFPTAWMSRAQLEAAIDAVARYDRHRQINPRQAIDSEVAVEFEIEADGPIMVQGRIDRLERDLDGRIWVIDYKTGKYLPTKRQVQSNIQLGAYQLGISLGVLEPLLGSQVELVGAELVYLTSEMKTKPGRPRVLGQDCLRTHPLLDPANQLPTAITDAAETPDPSQYPTWVHHRIAVAAALIRKGKYPAFSGSRCRNCAFVSGCPVMIQRQP